jgi:hypothetical protein
MADNFNIEPEFVSGVTGSLQGASGLISGVYSAVPAAVPAFCMPLGPLAVDNMIPQVAQTMATNCASGMLNAASHAGNAVKTAASSAAYTAADGAISG